MTHAVLVLFVGALIAILPTEKKNEPKKIAIYLPPIKTIEPVAQQPVEAPQQIPSTAKSEPIKVPLQQPIHPKQLHSSNPPIAQVSAIIQTKVQETPVQKIAEATVPIAKPAQIYKAPVELKSDPRVKDEYINYIRQMIDEHKIYPKNAKRLRQSGVVHIKFTLLDDGTIKGVSVVHSSGFELLDNAGADLLSAIGKVRAIPKEIGKDSLDLTIPIEYALK